MGDKAPDKIVKDVQVFSIAMEKDHIRGFRVRAYVHFMVKGRITGQDISI